MMSKKYTTFEERLFKILTFQKNTVSGLLLFYIELNLLILVKYIMDTIFSGLKKKKKKKRTVQLITSQPLKDSDLPAHK